MALRYIVQLFIIISLISIPIQGRTEFRLPVLVSDGMVLQRDCPN